jgi:hypothetical protein
MANSKERRDVDDTCCQLSTIVNGRSSSLGWIPGYEYGKDVVTSRVVVPLLQAGGGRDTKCRTGQIMQN